MSCRSTRCKRCTHAFLARCAASPASRSISRRSHLRRPSGSELMRRRPPLSPRDLTVIASCDGVARAPIPQSSYSRHPGAHTHTTCACSAYYAVRCPAHSRPLRSARLPELYVPRQTPRMVAAWPPQSPAAYATRPTLSCAFYTCPRGTEQSEHTAISRAALAPPTQPAQRRRPRRAPRRAVSLGATRRRRWPVAVPIGCVHA